MSFLIALSAPSVPQCEIKCALSKPFEQPTPILTPAWRSVDQNILFKYIKGGLIYLAGLRLSSTRIPVNQALFSYLFVVCPWGALHPTKLSLYLVIHPGYSRSLIFFRWPDGCEPAKSGFE